jgi:hypothetical protein
MEEFAPVTKERLASDASAPHALTPSANGTAGPSDM